MARAAIRSAHAAASSNKQKWGTPKPLMGILARASEMNSIHIFSVAPWDDWARMGSWGDRYLPALNTDGTVLHGHCQLPKTQDEDLRCLNCGQPVGKKHTPGCLGLRYVYCCTEPGAYPENRMDEGGSIVTDNHEGEYVAQCIVGEGPDIHMGRMNDDNRAKNGVFIGSVRGPKGRGPTLEDVDAAEARRLARALELVEDANEAQAMGSQHATLSINEKHHWAAKFIKRMDLQWVKDRNPSVMTRCPGCGDSLPETAVSCKCGRLLKPAEFWAEVQQGIRLYAGEIPLAYRMPVPAAAIESPKAKTGKPQEPAF